ncbi:hypothetical protein ASE17_14695 [Phenylobacterium sp. Root77]|uniref:DUF2061 domain-containing protein n=1 Tax=unclassified Phenylobacterium TaxID=2640670 RepID=UPI0007013193|nr:MULTISPECIES: DUF2061 domain-containing protein [unclassified Phenylobacterium]KQW71082.1 hypothetical protein ASC73_13685 [Phenylobacterium sp. Root1277]KQW95759.1 hypothetical protein ASC79_08755 [Phenylobacterium sp. Root1290]KRC41545.1 hypothetical protein ASE17_14695 [Phenylobacterium sp. Root77]
MRTAKKTLSYSVMHLIVAITVAYALTRDWRAALAIGMIEPIFQTMAFAVHERVWARIGAKGTTMPDVRSATVDA